VAIVAVNLMAELEVP